jgi:hypothetical protein
MHEQIVLMNLWDHSLVRAAMVLLETDLTVAVRKDVSLTCFNIF